MTNFKTSAAGIALIKQFEGCRLEAYKAVSTEKYYTIGYGHYGSDVAKGARISQAQAEAYLVADLAKFEKAVNSYGLSWMDQNKFDALVSFTYNCGAGNLKTLLNNGKRTSAEVSAKIPAYNKSGGKVLNGLTKRRAAEKALFDKSVNTIIKPVASTTSYYNAYKGTSTSIITALKEVGEKDTSLAHRKQIGVKNGITGVGTTTGNNKMLDLLKKGKLMKA